MGIPERPLNPPEPASAGCCEACGEPLYAGSPVYRVPDGAIHPECLLHYLRDCDPRELAAALGYREEVLLCRE